MKAIAAVRLGAACALGSLTASPAASVAAPIPITTTSPEARELYLKGRDLAEKLRATDARTLFEQAAAKDPGFALAQVGLANSAGTAKEFFAAVGRAVALADKASEPEKLVVCALDAGAKGEPARQKDCLDAARRRLPRRRARAEPAGRLPLRTPGLRGGDRRVREGDGARPVVLAALQPDGLRVPLPGPLRQGRAGVQEVHRADPGRPQPLRLVRRAADEDGPLRGVDQELREGARRSTRTSSRPTSGSATTACSWASRRRRARPTPSCSAVARNDGERRQAHFWTAMSYVHEGAADEAVAEVQQMARDRQGGQRPGRAVRRLRARWATSCSRPAGSTRPPPASSERDLTIDKADVAVQVKDGAQRQALYDEARARTRRATTSRPRRRRPPRTRPRSRRSRSRSSCARATSSQGRIALAEKDYKTAAAALARGQPAGPARALPDRARRPGERRPARGEEVERARRRTGTPSPPPTATCGARPRRCSRRRTSRASGQRFSTSSKNASARGSWLWPSQNIACLRTS